ncbi:MAG: helix-turn-helix domain-containing protein [Candidatus Caldarchaeum sp.]
MHPNHPLEEALKTYQHIRVVKTLAEHEKPATKYALAKLTGLSLPSVQKILNDLIRQGWVSRHQTTPPKYSLNPANQTLRKFLSFLSEAEYLLHGRHRDVAGSQV